MKHPKQPHFLPISHEELRVLGIDQPDIIMVSCDAYVDHPSFAAALLGRVLWDAGFICCDNTTPGPKDPETFRGFGEPSPLLQSPEWGRKINGDKVWDAREKRTKPRK